MTGWNLPPGVNVSDLPGNRPEDSADEVFWDRLLNHPDIPSDHLPEEWWDDEGIVGVVKVARDLAYSIGYAEGQADALTYTALARERESESAQPQPQTIDDWEAAHGSVADDNP